MSKKRTDKQRDPEARQEEPRVPITDAYLAKLRAEIDRTNIGAHRFHTLNASCAPHMSVKTIENWLRGYSRSALQSDLDYVLAQYQKYPTWLSMTGAMRSQFEAEVERTGIASPGALAAIADVPEDLNSHALYSLFDGTLKGIQEDHWAFVIDTLQAQDDAIQHGDQIAALNDELKRTGIAFSGLSERIRRKTGHTYEATFLKALANGKETSLTPQGWEMLFDVLSELPDAPQSDDVSPLGAPRAKQARIKICEAMRDALNAELERTGAVLRDIGPRLLPRHQTRYPELMIGRWRNGVAKSASEEDWDRVMTYLASLPDKIKARKKPARRKPSEAKPTPKKSFSVKRPDDPERHAALSNANDERAVPDLRREDIEPPRERKSVETYKLRRQHKALGYVVISEELYQQLHAERRRTLVSARRLVASSPDAPGGLQSRHIDFWLLGKTLAAEAHYLDWTLKAYRRLPTAPSK